MMLSASGFPTLIYSCTEIKGNISSPEQKSSKPQKSIKIKVGTYNIAHCREIDYDPKIIANDIMAQGLDIVGIQEVDRLCARSWFIDTPELLSEYTGYYYAYSKSINLTGDTQKYGKEGEYGTLILSKHPILEQETVIIESAGYEQRSLGYARLDVDGIAVDFFNTHLSFESSDIRSIQFSQVAKRIENSEYCIITGDFNVDKLEEFDAIPLSKINNKKTAIVTFPKGELTIDNIYYSCNMASVSHSVVNTDHSDHYMLIAELETA